jgi:hypothetical protein
LLSKAADMRYQYMQEELDALKLQIKEISLREKHERHDYQRPIKFKI